MNIIMNKNMKKRLDSAIDLYFFATGQGGTDASSKFRMTRIKAASGTNTTFFADIYGGADNNKPVWPTLKNTILPFYGAYRRSDVGVFQRKFSKLKVQYKSGDTVIFTDTIDMIEGTTWSTRFQTDSTTRATISCSPNNTTKLSFSKGVTFTSDVSSNTITGINYPILVKTAYVNGVAYNQAKVTPTVDGDVRVSLIPPFDWVPTQTGVSIDSFQINFFDDANRPTAVVTGTIGGLDSSADVKMPSTLIKDGSYVNISGLDDVLITTPNSIAISN